LTNMRRVAAVVLLVVVVVSAGCSRDADTSDATSAPTESAAPTASSPRVTGSVPSFLPESLDHNGYVARLRQICTDPGLGGDIGIKVTATSSAEEVDATYGAIETRLDLMRQMPPPDDDQQLWSEVEDTYDRFLTTMSELSDARAADDSARSEQLESDLEWLREDVGHNVAVLDIANCGV
jgi:hypothetical protein